MQLVYFIVHCLCQWNMALEPLSISRMFTSPVAVPEPCCVYVSFSTSVLYSDYLFIDLFFYLFINCNGQVLREVKEDGRIFWLPIYWFILLFVY